uniref:ATP synthase F0 subunit 6 n=1 Tax=Cassianeura bimaculata TaxID=2932621 RepID=UPI001FF6AE44|nr:ATP synthase F0 subunit 6 [Cassianeura bimaculata]UOH96531.1 ATP synthase F0 subunit 6 [Cassianeura bimaculata]
MMSNLFSVFDPCTGMLSLNWMSTLIFLILMPYNYWFIPNKINLIYMNLMMMLHKETKMLMSYNGTSIISLSLFTFILFNNLMGLLPYIFTSSSHLIYSLGLALPIWLSLMIYGWINKYNSMFCHLVPSGTPGILMPFMVMIETVSNIIRPGSLSVRLTANMIAGHLLMSLLGNNSQSLFLMVSTMLIYLMLMLFELAVALIQSYVFMTLGTLYSSEI